MSRGPSTPFRCLPEDKIRDQCSDRGEPVRNPSQALEHADAFLELGPVIYVREFGGRNRLAEESAKRLPALSWVEDQEAVFGKGRFHVGFMLFKDALRRYEAGENPGAEANMAKMLAAEASFEAANVCVQTHGGFGFAQEYDVERKFRETRLYQVAPISTNLILSYIATSELDLPRSF